MYIGKYERTFIMHERLIKAFSAGIFYFLLIRYVNMLCLLGGTTKYLALTKFASLT